MKYDRNSIKPSSAQTIDAESEFKRKFSLRQSHDSSNRDFLPQSQK